jgi:hypothetical protein
LPPSANFNPGVKNQEKKSKNQKKKPKKKNTFFFFFFFFFSEAAPNFFFSFFCHLPLKNQDKKKTPTQPASDPYIHPHPFQPFFFFFHPPVVIEKTMAAEPEIVSLLAMGGSLDTSVPLGTPLFTPEPRQVLFTGSKNGPKGAMDGGLESGPETVRLVMRNADRVARRIRALPTGMCLFIFFFFFFFFASRTLGISWCASLMHQGRWLL